LAEFKEGDTVKLKPDVIRDIKKQFGEDDDTAYVDFPGKVRKVFSAGIMVAWENGTTNVNPKEALIAESIKENRSRIHNFSKFVNEAYSQSERYYKILNLQKERDEKQEELNQMRIDMEEDPDIEIEGGPIADKWGGELNRQEKEIEKLDNQIEKLENPVTRKKREAGIQSDAKKKLLKNIEDVKRSMKSWPDRTIEEQAAIYKKRYGITDEVNTVIDAIKELQAEEKL
jgi:hypothetical protein